VLQWLQLGGVRLLSAIVRKAFPLSVQACSDFAMTTGMGCTATPILGKDQSKHNRITVLQQRWQRDLVTTERR